MKFKKFIINKNYYKITSFINQQYITRVHVATKPNKHRQVINQPSYLLNIYFFLNKNKQ